MTVIADRRLANQRLTGEPFDAPVDAVGWLGAMQAQDYSGAKWAIGLRTRGATDADLDRLYDQGAFLRTHVMRPTWHFVLPADIRWLLELTGPRVKRQMAPYDRWLEVDEALLGRCRAVFESALGGGLSLTRSELATALERAGIPARGQRLAQIMLRAELDAIVASGPRRGRQFTYALLDERVAPMPRLDRDEALAELTRRYFTGHGPAQIQDFAWWSGLTVADARRGLGLVGKALAREELAGNAHWSSPTAASLAAGSSVVRDTGTDSGAPIVHLLPNYDEFLIAYRDRSASLDPARGFDTAPFPYGSLLAHVVVLDGQVWGGWKRRIGGRRAVVELGPLHALTDAGEAALRNAADRLAAFLALPVTLAAGPSA